VSQRFTGGEEGGSGGAAHGGGSSPATGTTFRPWAGSPLSGGGTGTPLCSYAAQDLFCVSPGLKAAKLDPVTGEVVWSRPESADVADGAKQLAPVLTGGVLRVVTGDGSRLEGLDPDTGKTRWDFDMSAYHGAYYSAGSTVLLIAPHGGVTAVDSATGRERWHRSLPGHTRPVFATYGDSGSLYAVEVADDGASTLVTAVDPADGTQQWQRRLDGDLTPVGSSGGALYFTAADAESRTDAVVRYDLADRTTLRVPLALPMSGAQAAVHGDTVYVFGYGGALVAVDTGLRKQLWRTETSVTEASLPVVAGGRLYLTAADGRLLAFDEKTGGPLGQTRARLGKDSSGYVQSVPAPVAAGGRVYAGAPDGTVFAVDAKDPSRW
jgi:outer membrane protein assembly factor BamB